MILIHVEHFLDEKGQEYFPRWLEEVNQVLKGYNGFRGLRQLHNLDTGGGCHLLLEFESRALFDTWATSIKHDEMVARLAPFRVKPPAVSRYYSKSGRL